MSLSNLEQRRRAYALGPDGIGLIELSYQFDETFVKTGTKAHRLC